MHTAVNNEYIAYTRFHTVYYLANGNSEKKNERHSLKVSVSNCQLLDFNSETKRKKKKNVYSVWSVYYLFGLNLCKKSFETSYDSVSSENPFKLREEKENKPLKNNTNTRVSAREGPR